MSNSNPLKLDFSKRSSKADSEKNSNRCPKCNSTDIKGYSHYNGTGSTCNKCNHYWLIGHIGGLSPEESREFTKQYNQRKEENMVKISDNLSMPAEELERIENTIEANYEFLRRRMG